MQLSIPHGDIEGWPGAPGRRYPYRLHGLALSSEIPCPGLAPGGGGRSDLRLLHGELPESLPDAALRGYKFDARPGTLLLRTQRIASFLISRGDQILTELRPGCRASEFHNLLLGWALGALLHQREAFPLHAGALEKGGLGLIVCGDGGMGKSSIACGLMERGYRLLDDNLIVPRIEGNRVIVHPGQSRLKLTGVHLRRIGIDVAGRESLDRGGRKFAFDAGENFADSPATIERLFILCASGGAEIVAEPLAGAAKIHALAEHTFNPHFLPGLGKEEAHFRHVAALATRLDCHRLHVPHDENFPDALLEFIEAFAPGRAVAARGS